MSGVSDSLVSGNDGGNSAVDGDGLALAAAVARHYRLTLGQDRTGGDHHYLYQALALALRDHIALELLPGRLRGRGARALYVLHDLATLCIAGLAADASWQFVQRIAAIGPRSMALGLPMAIPHGALLAGLAGLAAVALFHLVRDLRLLLRAGREGDA